MSGRKRNTRKAKEVANTARDKKSHSTKQGSPADDDEDIDISAGFTSDSNMHEQEVQCKNISLQTILYNDEGHNLQRPLHQSNLNDDASTISSIDDESKRALLPVTTGFASPSEFTGTPVTERTQPMATNSEPSVKQYDDSDLKYKRVRKYTSRKTKYTKKYKKSSVTPLLAHTVLTKKSTETAVHENPSDKGLHRVAVLFSVHDKFTLSQDICLCCGSIGYGIENYLIACFQCGQCYHHYCVSTKLTRAVITNGWRCLDCAVCEGCGKAGDEDRLLLCDDCDISYHTYCLNPQLEKVPEGEWKCHRCVQCYDCGKNVPGVNCQWMSNYTQCGPCASAIICPKCKKKYLNDDLVIQCNNCQRWFHGTCEGINNESDAKMYLDLDFVCSLCEPDMYLCKMLENQYIHETNKKIAKYDSSYYRDYFNPIRPGPISSEVIPFFRLKSKDKKSTTIQNRLKKIKRNTFLVSKVNLTKDGIEYMKKLEQKRKAACGEEDNTDVPQTKKKKPTGNTKKQSYGKKKVLKTKVKRETKKVAVPDSESYLINSKNHNSHDDAKLPKKVKKKKLSKKVDKTDIPLTSFLADNMHYGHHNKDHFGEGQAQNGSYQYYFQQQGQQPTLNYQNNIFNDNANANYSLLTDHSAAAVASGIFNRDSVRGSEEIPNDVIDIILDSFDDTEALLGVDLPDDEVFNTILDDYNILDMKERNNKEYAVLPNSTEYPSRNYNDNVSSQGDQDKIDLQNESTLTITNKRADATKNKHVMKCQREETLGDQATMASILYANLNHPQLQTEYPEIITRIKVVERLWRKLEQSERAKYISKAKENRRLLNCSSKSANDKVTVKVEKLEGDGILIPQAPLISHPVVNNQQQGHHYFNGDNLTNFGVASLSQLHNIWSRQCNNPNETSAVNTVSMPNQNTFQSYPQNPNNRRQNFLRNLNPLPKPVASTKVPIVTTTHVNQQTEAISTITADIDKITVSKCNTYTSSLEYVSNVSQQSGAQQFHTSPTTYKENVNHLNGLNQPQFVQQEIVPNQSQPMNVYPPIQHWSHNRNQINNQALAVNQMNVVSPQVNRINCQPTVRPNTVIYQCPQQPRAVTNNEIRPIRPMSDHGSIIYYGVKPNVNFIANDNANSAVVKQEMVPTQMIHARPPPGAIQFCVQPARPEGYRPQVQQASLIPISQRSADSIQTNPQPTPNMTETAMQQFIYPTPLMVPPQNYVDNKQFHQPMYPVYNRHPNFQTWTPVGYQQVQEQYNFVPMVRATTSQNIQPSQTIPAHGRVEMFPQKSYDVMYPIGSSEINSKTVGRPTDQSHNIDQGANQNVAAQYSEEAPMGRRKSKTKPKKPCQSRKRATVHAKPEDITLDPDNAADLVARAKIEALKKFSEYAKSPGQRQMVLDGAKEHLQARQMEDTKANVRSNMIGDQELKGTSEYTERDNSVIIFDNQTGQQSADSLTEHHTNVSNLEQQINLMSHQELQESREEASVREVNVNVSGSHSEQQSTDCLTEHHMNIRGLKQQQVAHESNKTKDVDLIQDDISYENETVSKVRVNTTEAIEELEKGNDNANESQQINLVISKQNSEPNTGEAKEPCISKAFIDNTEDTNSMTTKVADDNNDNALNFCDINKVHNDSNVCLEIVSLDKAETVEELEKGNDIAIESQQMNEITGEQNIDPNTVGAEEAHMSKSLVEDIEDKSMISELAGNDKSDGALNLCDISNVHNDSSFYLEEQKTIHKIDKVVNASQHAIPLREYCEEHKQSENLELSSEYFAVKSPTSEVPVNALSSDGALEDHNQFRDQKPADPTTTSESKMMEKNCKIPHKNAVLKVRLSPVLPKLECDTEFNTFSEKNFEVDSTFATRLQLPESELHLDEDDQKLTDNENNPTCSYDVTKSIESSAVNVVLPDVNVNMPELTESENECISINDGVLKQKYTEDVTSMCDAQVHAELADSATDTQLRSVELINNDRDQKNVSLQNDVNIKPDQNDIDDRLITNGTTTRRIVNLSQKRLRGLRWKHWKQSSDKRSRGDHSEVLTYEEYLQIKSAISPQEHISDERCCEFCGDVGDGKPDKTGRLLNLDIDKWVHVNCALWSYDVYETLNGALHQVQDAYAKSKRTNCIYCKNSGATIRCYQRNCNRIYHFNCAMEDSCYFYANKTVYCLKHADVTSNEVVLQAFNVNRKVFIKRDELMQISRLLKDQVEKGYILRVGTLIFRSLGQLAPRHLSGCHSSTAIYPPGYEVSRIYWCAHADNKRCFYSCLITESAGIPKFLISSSSSGSDNFIIENESPKAVWQRILDPIKHLRQKNRRIKIFDDYITGEDLFGLVDPWILRLLESLPGIDRMKDYKVRYGRCSYLELPLAINPSGCARAELIARSRFKRRHTLCPTAAVSARAPTLNIFDTHQSYTKQFVHSKAAQYRKLKSEWRSNVYLGRSSIQGLGLYARRNIEKDVMVIEYIGGIIRNEVANKRERIYEKANHGIYMFRIDPDFVIDATEDGGLARYINHSCQPNCVAEVVTFDNEPRIIIISNRRIAKGEELTYDYKFEYEDDQHKIPCMCGASNCRGWMN